MPASLKFSEERAAVFLEAIRKGNTVVNSCALAGIHHATFYNWQMYARQPGRNAGVRARILAFLESYRRLESEALAESLEQIRKAAEGTLPGKRIVTTVTHVDGSVETSESIEYTPAEWRAAAWFIERRKPREWGRRDRTPVDVEKEAERLASELGVPVEDLLAEAEMIQRTEG